MAAKKDEDLLSWAGWEDCGVLYEDCDASGPEARMKTLTAWPPDTFSSLTLFSECQISWLETKK